MTPRNDDVQFLSDDSFPVKTGSCPTEMVDLSFNAEYLSYPKFMASSDL